MPVITDPELLKVIKKWREDLNYKVYNNIVSTEYPISANFDDISGKDFGYIHVNKYCGRDKTGHKFYYCTCNYCGSNALMSRDTIVSNLNKTCGCYKYHHNGAYERLYRIYQGIYTRCYNENSDAYYKYGDRGIKMDNIWLGSNGYISFKSWAYDHGYSIEYENDRSKYISVDRIDNDKGYGPNNCRLVSMKVQSNNRSTTRFLRYNEYVFPLGIWCEITELPRNTFLHRLERGWTVEEALLTPRGAWYKRGEDLKELVIPDKYLIYNKYAEFKAKGILDTCVYP